MKEVERYENDKKNISDKAKELEAERDLVSRRADRFDGGEVFLEIGLVICSITLLTKNRFFWFTGMPSAPSAYSWPPLDFCSTRSFVARQRRY